MKSVHRHHLDTYRDEKLRELANRKAAMERSAADTRRIRVIQESVALKERHSTFGEEFRQDMNNFRQTGAFSVREVHTAPLDTAESSALETFIPDEDSDLSSFLDTASVPSSQESSQLNSLDSNQLTSLDSNQITGLDSKQLTSLDSNQITGLDSNQLTSLDSNQITGLDSNQLTSLDSNQIADQDSNKRPSVNSTQILDQIDSECSNHIDGTDSNQTTNTETPQTAYPDDTELASVELSSVKLIQPTSLDLDNMPSLSNPIDNQNQNLYCDQPISLLPNTMVHEMVEDQSNSCEENLASIKDESSTNNVDMESSDNPANEGFNESLDTNPSEENHVVDDET